MQYLKRLVELVILAFFAGALPVIESQGLSKASLIGAGTAGAATVYGLVAKWAGEDRDRPTIL